MFTENFSLKKEKQAFGGKPCLMQFFKLINKIKSSPDITAKREIGDTQDAFNKIKDISLKEYEIVKRSVEARNTQQVDEFLEKYHFARNPKSWRDDEPPF